MQGDDDALGQVVLNLLLNAIEAAQRDGIGRPGRSRVGVDVRVTEADVVEIVISDSGAGPRRESRHLFEPFVTSKTEGAGLGLAVAKEVVAAHGGTIGLESRERNDAVSRRTSFGKE